MNISLALALVGVTLLGYSFSGMKGNGLWFGILAAIALIASVVLGVQ